MRVKRMRESGTQGGGGGEGEQVKGGVGKEVKV